MKIKCMTGIKEEEEELTFDTIPHAKFRPVHDTRRLIWLLKVHATSIFSPMLPRMCLVWTDNVQRYTP